MATSWGIRKHQQAITYNQSWITYNSWDAYNTGSATQFSTRWIQQTNYWIRRQTISRASYLCDRLGNRICDRLWNPILVYNPTGTIVESTPYSTRNLP